MNGQGGKSEMLTWCCGGGREEERGEEIESKLTELRDDFLKPLVEIDAVLTQRKNDVEELNKTIASRKNALNSILEDAKKKLDEMIPAVKRARND